MHESVRSLFAVIVSHRAGEMAGASGGGSASVSDGGANRPDGATARIDYFSDRRKITSV